MGYFGATRAALAAERHVACPRLVHFAFDSEDVRLWEGVGDIVIDGETWRGFAELGSISDVAFGIGDAAGNITYTLSGVSPEVIAAAIAQEDEVRGRDVTLYGRFLDVDTLQPLDSSFVIRQDIMDIMSYSGTGPSNRSCSVTAETIWTNRNAAAYAYYSDRDQQYRFAGDLGLEFVVLMKNKRVTWPLIDAF